jgi:hypothetical protein
VGVRAEESEVGTLEADFGNILAFLAFQVVTLSSNSAASSEENSSTTAMEAVVDPSDDCQQCARRQA